MTRLIALLDVSYDDAAAHDEKVGAGWLERVLTAFAVGDTGVPTPLPDDALSADDFRRATEEVLRRQVTTGEGVIVGRGAVVLLREHPTALRVRLDGPPDRRARQAAAVQKPRSGCRAPGLRAVRPDTRGIFPAVLRRPDPGSRALPRRPRLHRDRRRRLRRDHRAGGRLPGQRPNRSVHERPGLKDGSQL